MSIHPFEQAINEQARGIVAEDNLEKGIKGKCLTKQQIWVPRKRTENIMIDMIDRLRKWKEFDSGKPRKSRRRRRRRGPRVFAVNFYEVQGRGKL